MKVDRNSTGSLRIIRENRQSSSLLKPLPPARDWSDPGMAGKMGHSFKFGLRMDQAMKEMQLQDNNARQTHQRYMSSSSRAAPPTSYSGPQQSLADDCNAPRIKHWPLS